MILYGKWGQYFVPGSESMAGNRLQKGMFDGKIDTVVVWTLDRLSHSLKDGINILTDWLEKDVKIIATSQQLVFPGPVGQMIASVLFAVAAMGRENLRENTKRGISQLHSIAGRNLSLRFLRHICIISSGIAKYQKDCRFAGQ